MLDRSYEPQPAGICGASQRLSGGWTPRTLAARLTGMCLLVVATVTADCRPIAGPLDGIFYRRAFALRDRAELGPLPPSARAAAGQRHAPAARGVRGQRARPRGAGGRSPTNPRALLEVYVPRYGAEWEEFLDSGPVYMRIDADRMFTFGTG